MQRLLGALRALMLAAQGPRQHRLRTQRPPDCPPLTPKAGGPQATRALDQPANSLGVYSTTSGLVIHWYASQNLGGSDTHDHWCHKE